MVFGGVVPIVPSLDLALLVHDRQFTAFYVHFSLGLFKVCGVTFHRVSVRRLVRCLDHNCGVSLLM